MVEAFLDKAEPKAKEINDAALTECVKNLHPGREARRAETYEVWPRAYDAWTELRREVNRFRVATY